MYRTMTLLTLMSRLPRGIGIFRTCTPNSQFLLNGRLCFCDNRGNWNIANCKTISRRHSCQPGQIIWHECNQCICQENGYLLCSNSRCTDDVSEAPSTRQSLSVLGLRCAPFRSYHTNCNICVCPASGFTSDIQCVNDVSCNSQTYQLDIASAKRSSCIPNVMYLSSCTQCWCTDRAYFDTENCVNTCNRPNSKVPSRICSPGTVFRLNCNLCRCPETGIPDERLCIIGTCNQLHMQTILNSLRTNPKTCSPHSFTVPRCMYCDCDSKGVVNENACIELDCAKRSELNRYYFTKATCTPGEMVPMCTECFCTRDGRINPKYCSTACSQQNKLNILEMVVKDSHLNSHVIERSQVKRVSEHESCIANTLYLDNGKYCLCSENGDTDHTLCTSVNEKPEPKENYEFSVNKIEADFNGPCEPNTFVEFECNTCYCSRTGNIDPKWCTHDDCTAKRLISASHKISNPSAVTDAASGKCQPGTISKLKCNFCICPESGILREQTCTQNDCTEIDHSMYNDRLICEPLAYYEVDCNVCYCPRDGIKNIAKCTKNQCEKAVLRSDSCIPGELFSDDCNLCVCPPDGNKIGKACTDHACPKVPSWKMFKMSDNLINNQAVVDKTRSLDHCFRGEQFVEGCKLCVCPELELKMYATCEPIPCDEKNHSSPSGVATPYSSSKELKIRGEERSDRSRRSAANCYSYNISHSPERVECTPGSMYIIRCRQCICPYIGNINNFCRPLPKNVHCEQAFPNYNYVPMGRRQIDGNTSTQDLRDATTNDDMNTNPTPKNYTEIKVKHNHTVYECKRQGRIVDRCFICECEDGNVVIEEHCFRNDAPNCTNTRPTFLVKNKVEL